MENIQNDWLDYYTGHYLKSVAELFANNPDIPFYLSKEAFKESKNIKNQRERKKILKTIYHHYDSNHLFFNDSYRTVAALKKNNITSKVLSHYLNANNFDDYADFVNDFDSFNKFGEDNVQITKKSFDLKEYLNRINTKLHYPLFFDDIKNCVDGFKLDPVNNLQEVFQLSKKYQNCWQTTMQSLISRNDMFLINVKDNKDGLIGSLRYLKKSDDKIALSGWFNPDLVDGESFFEFSETLLKDISANIYKSSEVEEYNPDKMCIELHYNNPEKTISVLSPWNVQRNDIQDFINKKQNKENIEPNVKHRKKLKM